MSEATPARFLIVRLGSLGDLVHTLPAVAALRASFPSAAIDWVVEEKWSPLISLVEGIDHVIPLRRTRAGYFACVSRLRAGRYTCAVDFQGLYKSALLALLSGAARRVGFDCKTAREPGAAWFYTERVAPAGRHVVELNLSLAVRAGAERPAAMEFPLRVATDHLGKMEKTLALQGIAGDYVVVSPGGGWTSKCWPAQRYGELCGELWRRHRIPVVVNEGPGEAGLAAGVIQGSARATIVTLKPTLPELCALLAQARTVVAADTGPLHLAAALGTRVVALFGPTDPARNGPMYPGTGASGNDARYKILRKANEGATTYKRGSTYSPAMLALTVAEVAAAVECELSAAR